jgi:hypothetical protein
MYVYEPPHYAPAIQCRDCWKEIKPKTVVFISPDELQYLYYGTNNANSLRCSHCGLEDYYITKLRNDLDEMLRQDAQNPAKERKPIILVEMLNQIVRHELKKILKEEAADPHGTFSPAS